MKRQLFVLALLSLSVACNRKSPEAAATPGPPAAAHSAAAALPSAPVTDAATPANPHGDATPASPHGATTPMPEAKPLPAKMPDVVARVNGDAIRKDELEAAMTSVEARAGHPIPDGQRAAFTRSVLDQLVDFHVLAVEARARKVQVNEAEVNARLAQMKQGFPNEQAFQQALAQQHVTWEQLQTQARMGMQIDKLVDAEISSKIAVQDSDVAAFYQQNTERFQQGESVHASHILISVPQGADEKQKAAAKQKADAVLKQVKGGADFAKVAKEESQDPGSAQNGGDLGYFPKGQMEPHFEAAAFALKPGGVSDIVETPFGYHIIKLHERREAHTASLAEVSGEIKQFLSEQQKESKLQQFVDSAKSKMKIEILI